MTEKLQAGGVLHDGATLAQLLHCHVAALRNLGSTNEASAFLEAFITQNGSHNEVLSVAAELYAGAGQFDKELQFLDELVKREPTRPDLLARKGLSQLELSEFESAVITLTAALNIVPKNEYARLYRAVAYLGLGRLEDARADYQELLASSSSSRNALFGLGTVAWRQSQTNLAINYYKQFLSTRAGSTPETRQDFLAKTRLSDLQSRN
jgi:tetratricopeptide (TPR) repeat protein